MAKRFGNVHETIMYLWAYVARNKLYGVENPEKIIAGDIKIMNTGSIHPLDRVKSFKALVKQGFLKPASKIDLISSETRSWGTSESIPDHRLFYIKRFEESKAYCAVPEFNLPDHDRFSGINLETDGYRRLGSHTDEAEMLYVYWHQDKFEFINRDVLVRRGKTEEEIRCQFKSRIQDVIRNNLRTILNQAFQVKKFDGYYLNTPRAAMVTLRKKEIASLKYNADRVSVVADYFKRAVTSKSDAIRTARHRMIEIMVEHLPMMIFAERVEEGIDSKEFKYIASHMDLFTYEQLYGRKYKWNSMRIAPPNLIPE